MSKLKIAIVQSAPAHLDLNASVNKVVQIIRDNNSADLIVFGETWLTGYPAWLDHGSDLNVWNGEPLKRAYGLLLENSPTVEDDCISTIKKTAKENSCWVYIGLHERYRRSLFNSILAFSDQGEIAFHHRKMVPTFTEKLIHKPAETFDLKVTNIKGYNVGALICWEHWMPLARQYYHNLNEDIHIALWPSVNEIHQIASRHYAFEGRCYVIAVGQIMKTSQIPLKVRTDLKLKDDHGFLLNGGSCLISPNGQFITNPVFDKEEIIIVDIPDKQTILSESMTLDVAGHYSRQDLFNFGVK